MTTKEAIDILYYEATNEERKYSLEEIEKAKETLECLEKINFIILGGKRINIKKIESYFCDLDNPRIFVCLFDDKIPYIINFKTNEEQNNAIDKLDKLLGVMIIKEE